MSRLDKKIALITGGSRGIGAATANLFASEGATVLISDILALEGETIAGEIGGTFYYLDVSEEKGWQQVSKAVRGEFGRLDILFNNAGITGLNADLGPTRAYDGMEVDSQSLKIP